MPRGSVSRILALLIAMLYLLQPLHEPIKLVVHSFSHFMQKPVQIISHNEFFNSGTVAHHDSHSHQYHQVIHDHRLIDFLDALFSGEDKETNDDQTVVEILKIDKHNIVNSAVLDSSLIAPVATISKALHEETNSGYLQELLRPPVFL